MPEFAHCLPPHYRAQVRSWLEDDVPHLDIGGFVVGEEEVEAFLLCKGVPEVSGAAVGGAVVAGVPFFTAVFEDLGCRVEWLCREGDVLAPPARAAIVRGPARAVLLGERTGLNILTRASGVATAARAMSLVRAREGWHGEVAGSRKLTPGGFRLVEKYALLVGGVSTHRMDLSQMTMLKGACCPHPCCAQRKRRWPPSPTHTPPPPPARSPSLRALRQTITFGLRAPLQPPCAPQGARAASAPRWRWRRAAWRRRWRLRARAQTLSCWTITPRPLPCTRTQQRSRQPSPASWWRPRGAYAWTPWQPTLAPTWMC